MPTPSGTLLMIWDLVQIGLLWVRQSLSFLCLHFREMDVWQYLLVISSLLTLKRKGWQREGARRRLLCPYSSCLSLQLWSRHFPPWSAWGWSWGNQNHHKEQFDDYLPRRLVVLFPCQVVRGLRLLDEVNKARGGGSIMCMGGSRSLELNTPILLGFLCLSRR